jgi:tetratricopeptide (TPR) repeat protein
MFQPNCLKNFFILSVLFFVLSAFVIGQTEDARLTQLRRQLAVEYLLPAPHLALAKYYWQKGDRLQAFYISEYARRARFPEPIFNQAFANAFSGAARFSNGPVEMSWLNESTQNTPVQKPNDKSAEDVFDKAVEMQKQGKIKQAEELFVKAAELAPESIQIQSWTGRFFYKVKADNQRALEYYLNAYFLSPHAYETEFVESRIRTINWEAAEIKYAQSVRSGISPTKILNDANPTVVLMALEQMNIRWKPEYLNFVIERMTHDDETVRWQATEAVMKNVNRSFDKTLASLLQDEDLRRRGLAAYIAVYLWKQESFPVLQNMLNEKAQLLRFDALSALTEESSPEALKIIAAHRQTETDATLKELIDKSLQKYDK